MGNVYLLLPGSAISCVFSLIGPLRGMRARYNGALLARNNAFAESKLRYLVACKYTASNERELLALIFECVFFFNTVSGSVVENTGPTRERRVTWYV